MKFSFKKLFVKGIQEREVEVIKTWTVSWYSKTGKYFSDEEKRFEVFTNEEAAEQFKQDLESAESLLQDSFNRHIRLKEN